MEQEQLLTMVKKQVKEQVAAYVNIPNIDEYLVRPGCKGDQGILGALLLAKFKKYPIS